MNDNLLNRNIRPSAETIKRMSFRLFLALSILLFGWGASAQTVSLTPALTNVTDPLPANFTLTVEVQSGLVPIDAAAINLDFDPLLIQVVSVAPVSPFIQIVPPTIDNGNGTLSYNVGLFSGFPSGNFDLITVTFQAIAGGNTSVDFSTTNPSILASAGSDVLMGTTGADVTIAFPSTQPVITIGGPTTKIVAEGSTLQVPVSISDLDGNNLTVTVSSVSNEPKLLQTVTGGLQVDPFPTDASGFLTLSNESNTPGAYSADFDFAPVFGDGGGADGDGSGDYTITVEVFDGTNTVSATFDVQVTDTPQPVPVAGITRIEAESFDNQGPANTSPTDNTDDQGIGVEINPTFTNIGFTNAGDYAEYLIDVAQAGTYDVTFNVSKNSGAANTMTINGGPAAISVANNGDWTIYSNTTAVQVVLAAGPQTLRFDWSGASGFLFNMDYFELALANIPPTVSITSPLNGTTYTPGDNVAIAADAMDSDGSVSSVEFFDGAVSLGVDNTAPYEATLSGITTGVHNLTAVATDDDNAQTTSDVVQITALSGEADVVLIPSATSVTGIGTTFTVTVEIQPVAGQPVDGATLTIDYDPVLIGVNGLTVPAMPSFNLPISGPTDDNNGTITYSGVSTGPFPTTNFEVFTIEFITLATGTADITFNGVNIITSNGNDITRNTVGTSIEINLPAAFELCIASGSGNLTAFGKSFVGDPNTTPPTGLGFTRANGKAYASYSGAISGTTASSGEELLFQKEVYGGETGVGGANPNFSYSIPVDNGLYQVDLYFAEVFHPAAGGRIFDVSLEGNVILDEYDPVDPIKDGLSSNQTAITRTYYINVADGAVDIGIGPASTDNGKISGLCVKGLTSANLMPATAIGNLSTDALVAAALPLGISDPEGDPLTVILNGLPANLSYNSGTQQIEGTPTIGDLGTYTINAIISDGTSSPITEEFLLTINAPAGDDPPIIAPVAGQAVADGTTLTMSFQVTDDNNPSATIQIFDKSIVPGVAPLNKIPFESGGVVDPMKYSLTESLLTPGLYELVWNTTNLDGRAYLARITANDGVNLPVTLDFDINIGQDIPGLIQAKTFSNPLPWYGSSVPGNGLSVAIENNGTENIGYIDNNDFVDYWINVTQAGTYDVRVAAGKGNGGTTNITLYEDDGAGGFVNYPAGPGLGSVSATNTGWQNYVNYYTQVVFTNPGLQKIRLGFNGGANIKEFEFSRDDVVLRSKVFLEGPYDVLTTNVMNDGLRAAALLPTTEPYTALGFTHVGGGGGETVQPGVFDVTGNDAIVDWVFIELRDKNNSTVPVATASALLQADGDIVGMDGMSDVSFPGVVSDDYYIAIRHRNHLGFRTLNAITLSTTPFLLNLTNGSVALYGINPLKNFSGVYAMFAGEANFDGQVNAVDLNDYWRLQNGLPYSYLGTNADFNLDGAINAVDLNDYWRLNNSFIQQLD